MTDDNLFPRWTFGSHVDFWPNLLIIVEGNIMHFNDFLRCELWKSFLDLENFLDVAFGNLDK